LNLARPERFELPTFWFVGRAVEFGLFEINNLDGPPSPKFTPRLVEARRDVCRPYVAEPCEHRTHARMVHPGARQRANDLVLEAVEASHLA
jgi:hypothetical protein